MKRLRNSLLRVRLSLALLTERRAALFIGIDLMFLFSALLAGLNGGSATDFWMPLVVLPALVIGVPILSDTVALERRSGTLDLALTSPGATFYFERRAAAVAVLAIVQSCLCILIVRAFSEPFALSGPLFQAVSVALFLSAVALNWAVRLRGSGAVMFATFATAAAFTPWLFSNPIHPPTSMNGPMTWPEMAAWAGNNLVLLAGAATSCLYARQRLARPELMIT